jgi:uncharacterized protein
MKEIDRMDWIQIRETVDGKGFVRLKEVLTPEFCERMISLYAEETLFRSTIDMQRYRFGLGEYKYFRYPLPGPLQSLREAFYPLLVPIANEWMSRLGIQTHYPQELNEFLATCHAKEQKRPTPLMLRYEAGGFNTLHQDIYGEVYFPFQIVFMLTQPGRDYEGGELVFVEQVPRAQSRAEVINPGIGDAVIFTTNFRPVKGSKGYYRAKMKHGVSPVKNGRRYSMGLIFHDAS